MPDASGAQFQFAAASQTRQRPIIAIRFGRPVLTHCRLVTRGLSRLFRQAKGSGYEDSEANFAESHVRL
jgi:hypothetical protein